MRAIGLAFSYVICVFLVLAVTQKASSQAVAWVYNPQAGGTEIGTHVIDDFDFVGGPWDGLTNRRITGVQFSRVAGNCDSTVECDAIVEIFAGNSCSFESVSMTTVGGVNAVPLVSRRVAAGTICGLGGGVFVTISPPVLWPNNENRGFVRIRLVRPQTTDLMPGLRDPLRTIWLMSGAAGSTAIGTVTPSIGVDFNGNGRDLPNGGLEGGAPVVGIASTSPVEHRILASGSTPNSLNVAIQGEVPATPPSCISLGNISATGGTFIREMPLGASEVHWLCFIVNAIDETAQTFLDIDTEGSSNGLLDTAMALYDSTGNLFNTLRIDRNDGSGNLSQLTFGTCRRSGFGDGRPYDGRDGDLPVGVYYLETVSKPEYRPMNSAVIPSARRHDHGGGAAPGGVVGRDRTVVAAAVRGRDGPPAGGQ